MDTCTATFAFENCFSRKSVKNYTRIIIGKYRIIYINGEESIRYRETKARTFERYPRSNRFDTFTARIFSTKWLRCIRLKNIENASDIRGMKLKLITFGKRTLSKHLPTAKIHSMDLKNLKNYPERCQRISNTAGVA